MQNGSNKQVLIIQSQVKQYRVPFFDKLHELLQRDHVDLRVAYSDPVGREAEKEDTAELSPEYGLKIRAHWFYGNRLVYQPIWRPSQGCDLVIVEQANKHLMNHVFLWLSAMGLRKTAFWGHGKHRGESNKISEWIKKQTLNRATWWFAYTAGTAEYLIKNGVSSAKITNVQNSIDTGAFREQLFEVSNSELLAVRQKLNISSEAKIGIFCGAITGEKLPEFLVKAAIRIKTRVPAFELIAMGNGPEKHIIESAARKCSWIHCLGTKFGKEKAIFFKLSQLFLMPGAIGLAILDAFTAGLPVVTTNMPAHGPEIEYLENGYNSLITPKDYELFSDAVSDIFLDDQRLKALQVAARNSAEKYTMDHMVSNFRYGILRALSE
jgi:L-malate glycosyltransferase